MKRHQVRTLKAKGRVNSPQALARLEEVLNLLAEIRDGCLYQYRLAERDNPTEFNRFSQQRQLKELRATFPEFANLSRRLQEGAVNRAAVSWQRYAKARKAGEKAGRPRYKQGRYRTIQLDSPLSKVIRFSDNKNPVLQVHTLPAIRLTSSQPIPTDRQPVAVRITLKGKRITVRLGYRFDIPAKTDPETAINPLGIDLGMALSVATSTGDTYRSPKQQYLENRVRKARQKLSKLTSTAIATGRAGNKAILDDLGKQVLSSKGRPMFRLVWTKGQPPKSYLKAKKRLSELTDKLASLRRDFRNRITTDVITLARTNGKDLLVMEDLKITNMTASGRGTMAKPSRNVKAKSGLNRSILTEAWGETLTMLEYKAERAGIPSIRVNARGTSITCSCCGGKDPKSRKSQARFTCTNCNYQDNADYNASVNIADRGLLYFQKRHGLTIETLRLARAGSLNKPGGEKTPEREPAWQPVS